MCTDRGICLVVVVIRISDCINHNQKARPSERANYAPLSKSLIFVVPKRTDGKKHEDVKDAQLHEDHSVLKIQISIVDQVRFSNQTSRRGNNVKQPTISMFAGLKTASKKWEKESCSLIFRTNVSRDSPKCSAKYLLTLLWTSEKLSPLSRKDSSPTNSSRSHR